MGEVFAGRYELLDPVASGGMGTIWRVLDRSDGAVKAAKILRQSDAASLLRFVREQSMRIDHTHVVTPLSWAGVDDRVLFTMPLVAGGSVAELVREQGALPLRWVVALTDQLLQALEAVHVAGIVHRDVKPGNLLLEPTGVARPHLRLTDFGIAAPVDGPRMTHAAMAIGTPGYMPPEQWRGADPDPRADLYAVGRVALEMLTGEPPRHEPPDVDLDALRTGDPARDAVLDLIRHATAAAVRDRPASATEMRGALAASGLLSLPPAPDDTVSVPDRVAHLSTVVPRAAPGAAPGARGLPAPPLTLPGSPGTARSASQRTIAFRADAEPGRPGRGGGSTWAWMLLLIGVVGLAVAVFLVVGA